MSLLDEWSASLGGQQSQAQRRASAIKADVAEESGAAMTKPTSLFDEWSSSLGAPPKQSRQQAIPTAVQQQPMESSDYTAGEFAGDMGRAAGGALAGGTLKIPKGIESGAKGLVRDVATGDIVDNSPLPIMKFGALATRLLWDTLGIRSMEDQFKDKRDAKIAVDRAMSSVSIPGVNALADYGDKVQQDILSGMSEQGKRRMAGSEPKGNIFKGEFSWGDDPTAAGYALQAAGVLGSLAPVVATAIVTRNPNAAAAVGGGMAAGEAAGAAKDYIGKLDHEQLLEVSPYYKTLVDNGIPKAEARQIVTDKAGETGALLQGMVAAVGGRVTGKLVTGAYDDILARVGGRTIAGRAAVGGAAAAAEEGVQEVAEGVASDIGIRSQIADKEIGEGSAANLVLGALGGGPVGVVRGAVPTDAQRLADAIDRDVRNTRWVLSADEAARQEFANDRRADPNQGVSISPAETVAVPGVAAGQQPTTAVNPQESDLNAAGAEGVAQQVSLDRMTSAAGTVDQAELQGMLDQVDQRNQDARDAFGAQPQGNPETLLAALNGIATDLQLQPGETLNVTEVTSDKRLNKFAEALSQAFGVNVHWLDFGANGMTTSAGRNLGAFTGYRLGDTVLISPNADFMETTWHELTHTLETKHPEVYARLRDTILQTVDPAMKQRLYDALNARRMQEVGKPMSASMLESELVAYVVGQQTADPAMLGQLFDSFQDKTLAQQFKDILVEILDKLSSALRGPQYIKDRQRVIRARDAIKTAFAEYQTREAAKGTQVAPPSTMPSALAQQVAVSRGATNATQVGQVQQGNQQQRPGVGPDLRGQGQAGQQQAPQQGGSGQTGGGNSTQQGGAFSREGLIDALINGKPASVTDLLAHPDVYSVWQNTNTLLRRAPPVKKVYDNRMQRLADREGMKLQAGPIKKFPRAFSKIWFDYEGDHTKIGDVVRSTLVVQDLRDLQDMVDALTSFFPGVTVKRNGWDLRQPVHPSGYRDVFFKGARVLGYPVELQMNFAAMLRAKDVAHELYKQEENLRRAILSREKPMSPGDISAAQDQIRQLQADQFELYSEAAQLVFDGANVSRQADSVIATPSDVQVDKPKERGAVSPVRALSVQADNVPSGARVTGTPLTSKNVVPSGNDAGIGISVSPEAIPNSSVTQQGELAQASRKVDLNTPKAETNPLASSVSPADAEGRIARRLKRKPGVGAPASERAEFVAGDKKLVVGKITTQDWVDRVRANMSTEELQDSRSWYRQLHDALTPIFGNKAPEYALAWLLSQKRASPTKGMTDVLRASDMAAGKQEVKKAGLNQQALIDVLQGRIPEGGVGAKLMDFLDSELGKDTRTIVRNDPRGRQPAAIDVWAQRDIGFVDPTVFEFIRKTFGEEAATSITPDKTTDGESQYEYGIDFYNDVVDYLNSINFDGGGWTAREVQAVGWVTMQKVMGVKAEFVRDIIGGNTRRISIGLAPGEGSPMADKLMGKEIPVETAQREISFLADLAGIRVRQNVAGVGAYLEWIEGAVQIDALASPEAVADFMDMVGYAFQQTELINTRPLASGKNMAVDVMSAALDTTDKATAFFAEYLKQGALDKGGEQLAPGFQQIVIDGVPGIRLLNFGGNWRQTQLAQMQAAINTAANNLAVKLDDIATTQVVLTSTKNDWKANPDGKQYLDSLKERGRVREAEQLQRRYSPSRFDLAGDGTILWGGEAAAEPGAGVEPTEVESVGQYSRPLVEAAAQGKPDAPDLFLINENPPVLTAVGAPAETLVIGNRTVMKVANPEGVGKFTEDFKSYNSAGFVVQRAKRIALTVDELRAVPRMLGNPVAVIKVLPNARLNRRESYKVVLDLVKEGNPVIAIIQPGVRQFTPGKRQEFRASEIASIYPVNQESSLRETNSELASQQLLYFNKGKAVVLASKIGNKLPALTGGATGLKAKKPGEVKKLDYDIHPNSNFSRSMAEDMLEQEKFLMDRAKQAGFNNVDEWIDSDYEGFVKAAAEWRQQNPVNEGFFARRISLQGNRFAIGERTRTERISNLFANEMSRVADVQQQVAQQGGTLTEETNIENALHRMYGRAGSRIDDFRKNVLKAIINDAAKANVNMNDVALYLYANHAKERNDYIRSINAQFPDGGSGMTDADAAAVLASLRSRGAEFLRIKAIADRLQQITLSTGQALLDGGLIDAATLQSWRSSYNYYVPLKGFEQVDENGQTGNGRFDPRDPFFKRAMGRGSRAGQLIENIIRDYEEAIVAAERNKFRQAFLKFALQNPDAALWEVDPMVMQRRWNKNQGLVDYALAVDDSAKRTIGVRVNGVPRSIRVNDPGMLSDLQMKSIFSVGSDAAKQLFGAWATINRTLAKLWTALSPAFVLTNAQRDLQFAVAGSAVERGAGQAVDIVKDFMPTAYAVMRAERNNTWGQNSELKAYYDMYRADGGKTGFMDLRSLEERQEQLISDFRNAQASIKEPRTYHRLALRYIKSAEDFIMDINSGIENAARVAAYKSVIERAGYNSTNAPKSVREEAATIAKNLTVNFNRRGKLTPLLSSFYLFFGPAVQGALRTGKLVFSKKGGLLAGSLVALGYIVASMAGGATGDDDEPFWDKEANRTAKLKNLMFFGPNGEQYTVPLAYGLGFFVNLGYALRDLQNGKNPLKVAAFMRDSFFTHFSPLGAADNFATFLSPTILDPAIVLSSDERENGSPLLPPDITGTTPDSERYWTSTRGTLLQQFTTWLNEATGGSSATGGGVSISPERLGYLLSFTTGGAGTFVKDVFNSIDLTMNVGPDAAMDKNAYPILKQFYKRDTGRGDQQAFFENSKTVKEAKAELKLLDESENPPAGAVKRLDINDAYASIEKLQRNSQKQLSRIRKEEISIIDDQAMSRRDKYLQLKALDDERRAVEQEFNRDFYGIKKSVGERR